MKVGNDLDVIVRSRLDGTVTVTMHHGKLALERTFQPLSMIA